MTKRLKILVLALLLVLIIPFFIYSPTIFQEGNPLPVGYGIIKSLVTRDGYAKIDKNKYIVKAEAKDIQKLKDYLAQNQIVHVDQLGAAHFFKDKQGNSYTAISRMYSTAFQVWDFNNSVNQGLILP